MKTPRHIVSDFIPGSVRALACAARRPRRALRRSGMAALLRSAGAPTATCAGACAPQQQNPSLVFQGLENQTLAFSSRALRDGQPLAANDWKISRLTFPRVGKNTDFRFQWLENITQASSFRVVITLLLALISTPLRGAERPENELPMYGGEHNPIVPQNKKASEDMANLGWKYFYRGDLDTAIKRFNQAWMFDRESVDAFWGFGIIMGRRATGEDRENDLKESIKFLEMAYKRSPTNARLMTDLAYSHTLLGAFYKDKKQKLDETEFASAAALFEKAAKQDASYPPLHANWSVLDFYQGDYQSAKKRLEKAQSLGLKPDPAYAADLQSKLSK